MKSKFSKDYQELIEIYKNLHAKGSYWGNANSTFDGKSLKFFFKAIKQVIESTKSTSLIDFGCGKAKYYFKKIKVNNIEFQNVSTYWNINDFYLYDPGFEKFNKYPTSKKDGVICIDVVEHIPPEDVIQFINDIFKLANKFLFIVIACYPANKVLPDKRNAHLTIKNPEEWRKIINNVKSKYPNISPFVICTTDRNEFIPVS